jgi:hypothetical protein
MEFQFESIGPALRIIILVFMIVFALVALGLAVVIAALPGRMDSLSSVVFCRSHRPFPLKSQQAKLTIRSLCLGRGKQAQSRIPKFA